MTYDAYSLLLDLTFASGFILFGQLLRAKVSFFQKFYIPASLIAGILGFLLGPGCFKVVPFSDNAGSYSGILIILVFVSMGIRGYSISTKGIKDDFERIGSYFCFKECSYALQYTIPIILSYLVLSRVFDDLHPGFGMLLGAGWAGGPGTAAAIGSTFAGYGWADATDLGMTSATIGILTGIFGGIILIKWATKNGITNYISDFGNIPEELRTGMVPEERREDIGKETVTSISLESLAWHLAFLLVPAGSGYLLTNYISSTYDFNMPSYTVAFLLAILFSFPLRWFGAQKYIDGKAISSIAGCATDYLIFFGITSIKLAIIVKYAVPLTILMVFGVVFIVGSFLYFAPRMNKKDWFERGMFVFGYLTGVYANSFMLTRIVDPERKSKTFEDTAIIASVNSTTDILVITLGPILLSTGKLWTFVGALSLYFIFFFGFARIMKWWYPKSKYPLARKAEAEAEAKA